MLCMVYVMGYSQVYHNPVIVNPFTGPKCVLVGFGYNQSIWSADYSYFGMPYTIKADHFNNIGSWTATIGMEFEGKDRDFGFGPFIFFSYTQDHWVGEFNTDNTEWIIRYEQEQLYLSGKIGAEVFYNYNRNWVLGLGAGLYAISAQEPMYTSNKVHLFSDTMIPDADLPNIVNQRSFSSFSMGILLKGDVKLNVTRNFFIGAQARLDLFPFYNNLQKNPRYIGFDLRLHDDNRGRLATFLTCGFRWQ